MLFQCGGFDAMYPDVSTAVHRVMPAETHPVAASLRALVAGPTLEELQGGIGSFFTSATAGAVNAVVVNEGTAVVDFNEAIYINNASTSTGGMFFMAELRANVFQFEEIDTVMWSVDGDCQAFGEWLQVGECMVDTRADWDAYLLAWAGEAVEPVARPDAYTTETLGLFPPSLEGSDGAAGSGCAPGTTSLPDGAWFGFARGRTTTSIFLDLACFWTGERANEVALANGETDVPVPNDYYISNVSNRLRELTVDPDVPVVHLDYTSADVDDPHVVIRFDQWGAQADYLDCDFSDPEPDVAPFCPVWLYINSGVVTEVVEQYVP